MHTRMKSAPRPRSRARTCRVRHRACATHALTRRPGIKSSADVCGTGTSSIEEEGDDSLEIDSPVQPAAWSHCSLDNQGHRGARDCLLGTIEEGHHEDATTTTASSISTAHSELGAAGWTERVAEDGPRLLLDLKALPYARSSHGAPLIRSKIIEALESVGKLNQGTCVVYNSGLYDGGLLGIKPSGWGVCSWPDGEMYEGEWHDGVPHGLGKSLLPTGDQYRGEWRSGARDGFGKLDFATARYRGGFEAGSFSRYGKLTCGIQDKVVYEGWFHKGKKEGWGHLQCKSAQYWGYFQNDVLHGVCSESVLLERDGAWHECRSRYHQGRLLWREPVVKASTCIEATSPRDSFEDSEEMLVRQNAEQNLISDAMFAEAKLTYGRVPVLSIEVISFDDNCWYLGETIDGGIDGLGIESVEREDGSSHLYVGRFCDGVRHGHGLLIRGIGNFYLGSFQHGAPHGIGFDLSHDMYYMGEVQNGERHGFGDLSTNQGVNFVGGFQTGQPDGRTRKFERAWGRWTRFNKKNGQFMKFAWEESGEHGMLATLKQLMGKPQPASDCIPAQLPPEGLMMLLTQGEELPFAPKQDDRFWDSMVSFYEGLAAESVMTAKEEAKNATLLVMEQLQKEWQSQKQPASTKAAHKEDVLSAAEILQQRLEQFILDHPGIKFYFYTFGKDKDRGGPVSFDDLVLLYGQEHVSLETYVWHKLQGDCWIKLKDNGPMLDALRAASIKQAHSRPPSVPPTMQRKNNSKVARAPEPKTGEAHGRRAEAVANLASEFKLFYFNFGKDDDRNGPVGLDAFKSLHKAGIVHMQTYIWYKELAPRDKWIKLKDNGTLLEVLRPLKMTRDEITCEETDSPPLSPIRRGVDAAGGAAQRVMGDELLAKGLQVKGAAQGTHSMSRILAMLIVDCINNPLFPPAPRTRAGTSSPSRTKGSATSSFSCVLA